ncbi:MAG: thiamine diphosphokinase [Spirochaetaceae bacterium]
MNSILITGGEIPDYNLVKHLFTNVYVCVADSGYDWVLENNIDFDFLVGDMDSIKDTENLKLIPNEKIEQFSTHKDDTDTIIGLKHLKKMGSKSVILIGGGGGRLDHLLGVFSLFETDLAPDVWFTKHEVVHKVHGKLSLGQFNQSSISIYPINKVDCSIASYGLKWDLIHVDWTYKSIGISNFVEKKDSWIDTGTNVFIVIVPIIGKVFE